MTDRRTNDNVNDDGRQKSYNHLRSATKDDDGRQQRPEMSCDERNSTKRGNDESFDDGKGCHGLDRTLILFGVQWLLAFMLTHTYQTKPVTAAAWGLGLILVSARMLYEVFPVARDMYRKGMRQGISGPSRSESSSSSGVDELKQTNGSMRHSISMNVGGDGGDGDDDEGADDGGDKERGGSVPVIGLGTPTKTMVATTSINAAGAGAQAKKYSYGWDVKSQQQQQRETVRFKVKISPPSDGGSHENGDEDGSAAPPVRVPRKAHTGACDIARPGDMGEQRDRDEAEGGRRRAVAAQPRINASTAATTTYTSTGPNTTTTTTTTSNSGSGSGSKTGDTKHQGPLPTAATTTSLSAKSVRHKNDFFQRAYFG